jgi:hypothetical protein
MSARTGRNRRRATLDRRLLQVTTTLAVRTCLRLEVRPSGALSSARHERCRVLAMLSAVERTLGPDLTSLSRHLLPFAQQMLRRYGEFYPFGATMDANGAIGAAAAYTSGGEHPESQRVLDLLIDGLTLDAQAGRIRAAGVCVDVLTIPAGETAKRDAICLKLAQVNGATVDVYVPYRKRRFRGVKYDEPYAAAGTLTLASELEG